MSVEPIGFAHQSAHPHTVHGMTQTALRHADYKLIDPWSPVPFIPPGPHSSPGVGHYGTAGLSGYKQTLYGREAAEFLSLV